MKKVFNFIMLFALCLTVIGCNNDDSSPQEVITPEPFIPDGVALKNLFDANLSSITQ